MSDEIFPGTFVYESEPLKLGRIEGRPGVQCPPRWVGLLKATGRWPPLAVKPHLLTLTKDRVQTISRVNEDINTRVVYDSKKVLDGWEIVKGQGSGTCADYAATKQHYLQYEGIPLGCMYLTYCFDGPQAHLVLGIDTDHGNYVLCNQFRAMAPHKWCGYRFERREQHGSVFWRKIII